MPDMAFPQLFVVDVAETVIVVNRQEVVLLQIGKGIVQAEKERQGRLD